MDGTENTTEKYETLVGLLREFEGVLIAYSGGVDSSLLLAASLEAQGENALAVTGLSPSIPRRESRAAGELAARLGARHMTVDTNEMSLPRYRENSPDRCYHCKKILFSSLIDIARREGLEIVVEGSNAEDCDDYRPGIRAVKEMGIRSPLAEVGLSKSEIREISRRLGLPTWHKPPLACLASRIPYGEEITERRLHRVERAEEALKTLGFEQVRVRDHGDVARIEVDPGEIRKFLEPEVRREALASVKAAGYGFVALDLEGYRTGAMNEVLEPKP